MAGRAGRRVIAAVAGAAMALAGGLFIWNRTEPTRAWSHRVHEDATATSWPARFVRSAVDEGGEPVFEMSVLRLPTKQTRAAVVSLTDLPKRPLATHVVDMRAVAVINGGYFDAKKELVGLLRIDGRDYAPLLSDTAPLSGVVTIDDQNAVELVRADDPRVAHAVSARQAGPFLIDPGGRLGIKPGANAVSERSVIAIADGGQTVLVIATTPVSLYDLARVMDAYPKAFGVSRIDRALNLDGGPSAGAAFHLPGMATWGSEPRGFIRDILVFSRK